MVLAYDETQPLAGPGSPPLSAPLRGNFQALLAGSYVNWCADPTYLIWTTATNSPHWALTGAGAALAREATILPGIGGFAAKVTAGGGAIGRLTQTILPASTFPVFMKGKEVSLGIWLYATTTPAARGFIYDGDTFTYTPLHGGGSVWEWKTVTKTLHASNATTLQIGFEAAAGTIAYGSGATPIPGAMKPYAYLPAPVTFATFRVGDEHGNIATGDPRHVLQFARPGIIRDVSAYVDTAPTGSDAILDCLTWDGTAYASVFGATKVVITAAQKFGSRVPDGTYERRCVTGLFGAGATAAAGGVAKLRWDQVGSGVNGANSAITVRVLQYARPWEAVLGITDIA
jgi:hypothetical protein